MRLTRAISFSSVAVAARVRRSVLAGAGGHGGFPTGYVAIIVVFVSGMLVAPPTAMCAPSLPLDMPSLTHSCVVPAVRPFDLGWSPKDNGRDQHERRMRTADATGRRDRDAAGCDPRTANGRAVLSHFATLDRAPAGFVSLSGARIGLECARIVSRSARTVFQGSARGSFSPRYTGGVSICVSSPGRDLAGRGQEPEKGSEVGHHMLEGRT